MKWCVLLSLGLGCAAPGPLKTVSTVNTPDARCLVVLLPGLGDTADSFTEHGFVRTFEQAGLSIDVVAVNATFGYYRQNQLLPHLERDVLEPVTRAHAYEELWLMGPSMGGFGSLFFAGLGSRAVDGVLAIAPYLGDKGLHDQIRAQGGLASWKAPEPAAATESTYQAQLWRWLQARAANPTQKPTVFLGWGSEDRLGPANALLGQALPPERVFIVPGAHTWSTWHEVLDRFLAEGTFRQRCARRDP